MVFGAKRDACIDLKDEERPWFFQGLSSFGAEKPV